MRTVCLQTSAFLAQMVERWPFKPMAVGSIPTEGVFGNFLDTNCKSVTKKKQKKMRRPGIEPGPPAWKAGILTTELSTLAPVYKNLKAKSILLYPVMSKWYGRTPAFDSCLFLL